MAPRAGETHGRIVRGMGHEPRTLQLRLASDGPVSPNAVLSRETDARLARALGSERFAAATRLYARYAPNVRRTVGRMLGSDAELEDVVQDVFVTAITNIGQLRDPALLKSWLLGIAVGKARDNLRARWRRRWLRFYPNEELPDHPVPWQESQADLAREVTHILDQLPPEERAALLLHRAAGLSLDAAAQTCSTSVSTFKRRLARGEAKFIRRAQRRPTLQDWLAIGRN